MARVLSENTSGVEDESSQAWILVRVVTCLGKTRLFLEISSVSWLCFGLSAPNAARSGQYRVDRLIARYGKA
jgi:hypothetical protein